MAKTMQLVAVALLLALLGGCDKGKEEATQAAPQEVRAPANGDEKAWRDYLVAVVKQNMQDIRSSPYMYYLPKTDDPEYQEKYDRQLDNVSNTVARGVLPGNMLAFGSPDSGRMADMISVAFTEAAEGSMQGVRVLFIGKPADRDRVAEAVAPSGAQFVFVDAR
ncbi:MAG TPA: hypothetical protein VFG21_06570 [Xanthomonadaceae bacterium]|nr:hypothetical protein [Xanthomonadaceae bacterium]